mmetsp:Transcript_10391/g.23499  ORF Transcript_10391/g.23499 Transcript_10391/m.23499 type:complete len:133 (+) Transcript_10391:1171-1569(+)
MPSDRLQTYPTLRVKWSGLNTANLLCWTPKAWKLNLHGYHLYFDRVEQGCEPSGCHHPPPLLLARVLLVLHSELLARAEIPPAHAATRISLALGRQQSMQGHLCLNGSEPSQRCFLAKDARTARSCRCNIWA